MPHNFYIQTEDGRWSVGSQSGWFGDRWVSRRICDTERSAKEWTAWLNGSSVKPTDA